ncbi:MAG: prolipoprotein diacylglyceryl transferase [Acidimicrobiales bacterium]
MRPIPIAFHVWFVEVHTYGIGLAIAFWFGLRYTERRLRNAGYPWQWVTGMFVWVVVGAILGARAMHVIAHYGYYAANPGQIIAIWQGGLSSFGGLIVGIPVGLAITRRRCPELPLPRFADLMGPVLIASWAVGRILGPQLMRAGGGHRTTAWFGMYYADQPGKRIPVPIFQSMEDLAILAVLLAVERALRRLKAASLAGQSDGVSRGQRALPPAGIVLGATLVLYGIERFVNENLWLATPNNVGSQLVQLAGIVVAIVGIVVLATRIGPFRRWYVDGEGDEPPSVPGAAAPPSESVTASPGEPATL